MAGTWRQFFYFFLLFYVCAAGLQLYGLFYPEECKVADTQSISARGCYTPLFDSAARLDLYVYTSTKPDDGFREWSLIYNTTNLNTSVDHVEVINVSLPHGVRQNGSLHAHAILVKSGASPDPSKHPELPDTATQYRHRTTRHDWLSTSAPLTRWMPPIGRNRSMLVGSISNKEQPSAAGDEPSDTQQESDGIDAGSQHTPADTLHVIGGLSLLSGLASMFPIDPAMAAARYGGLIAVAVSAEQYRRELSALALQREQEAALRDKRRMEKEAASLLQQALFKPEELPVTHWKPRMRLRYSVDDALYPKRNGPPLLYSEIDPPYRRMTYRMYGLEHYAPEFYVDDLAMTRSHLQPLSTNQTAPDPHLQIEFYPSSRQHVQSLKTIEMALAAYIKFGMTERDLDDVKHMFSDMSIKVLGLTYVISMLHMLFDVLAFKNDIGFFKSRKDFTGLSTRSLATSCCCSLVIFLYLLDNEYTSRIVLFSVGSGTAVEAWKVKRITKGGWVWRYGLPWAVVGAATSSAMQLESAQQRELQLEDNGDEPSNSDGGDSERNKFATLADASQSAGEKLTKEIDALGIVLEHLSSQVFITYWDRYYLSIALYPLVAAWGLYSLLYYPHKSWWSWLINTLANGVYSFGFVMMTPQLFINYKLKSVAHLPWRAFMYKAFNTFIDDAFAMIIDMPTKHRVMTLRDDLVFFIYLYQRYLYPVDKKRANEFGRAYEEDDESESSEAMREIAAKSAHVDNEQQLDHIAGGIDGGGESSTDEKKQQ